MHGGWKSNKKSYSAFWKNEATLQTVLPDRPVLIWQKLVKIAKIEKYGMFLSSFQTMWKCFDLDKNVIM